MAESANFRPNLQNLPSIFEIAAAETLDNLIYPALSRLSEYFNLRFSYKLWGRLVLNEEISPVLTWLLQYLYLRNRSSSFGESFYGLQRTANETGNVLSKKQQLLSASLVTFLPYFERKLKQRNANHEDKSNWEKMLLKTFYVYNVSKAVYTLLYLSEYASSHSPIFRIFGMKLRYPAEPPRNNKATDVLLKLFEVMAFFLQFLQWWYSSSQRRKIGGSLKNPEPMPRVEGLNSTPDGDCPVCLQKILTPTACSVSGYVYCWKCIVTHIKAKSTCPVTGYPIGIEDLVRIYDD